eukprot:6367495-Amphidinium_carterae.1
MNEDHHNQRHRSHCSAQVLEHSASKNVMLLCTCRDTQKRAKVDVARTQRVRHQSAEYAKAEEDTGCVPKLTLSWIAPEALKQASRTGNPNARMLCRESSR